ncbi:MAG: Fpg/Nei family DNA glycosylase [Candidatus Dormibacteraceae bacterium]
MPEGDTILRTANHLRLRLAGRRITKASPEKFQRLVGSAVTEVSANGKHLLIHFDNGLVLHSHMRMTGSWHVYEPGERWRKPAWQAKAVLENESAVTVLFSAPVVELRRGKEVNLELSHLGPDILAPELDLEEILNRARKSPRQPLGELLLDQRVAAGIGNIYKCESLWRLKLDPWIPAAELDDEALGGLYREARKLMQAALQRRSPHAVHGRARRSCPRCMARIDCRRQGDPPRFTYYCPRCQRSSVGTVPVRRGLLDR